MTLHELAERSRDGITVRLWWESETDEVTVTYVDDRKGEAFTLYPPKQEAMAAFDHPNSYPERARRPQPSTTARPQAVSH